MQSSAPATLLTPANITVLFNQEYANGDYWMITSMDGLDGEPIRAPIDDKAQTDGAILHDFWAGARHVTVTGIMIPGVSAASRRNEMERTLRHACRSMKAVGDEGRWEWTPDGEPTRALWVKCDVQPVFPPLNEDSPVVKRFIFGLVAANPNFD